MFMITKQGKLVQNSDILLYRVANNKIITIVNDEEQMKKFIKTGKEEDAPMAVIPYSEDVLTEIINEKKQIESYQIEDDVIEVNYTDGTSIKFSSKLENIIKSNFNEQQKKDEEENTIIGSWSGLSDEEKKKKRKNSKKNIMKGLSTLLIAAVLAGSFYGYNKLKKDSQENADETTISTEETTETTEETKEEIVIVSEFSKEAVDFYKKIEDLKIFDYSYKTTWNEDVALEVIEYINGVYPSAMNYMNEEEAQKEVEIITNAIEAVVNGNLYAEEAVDLSQYIVDEKSKELVLNTMSISRECVQASIANVSENEYENLVDKLLNYQFETTNHTDFYMASGGTRYLITSLFRNANKTIPAWSFITRQKSERDVREYDLYYRYFYDDYEHKLYLPEDGEYGEEIYRAYWADEVSKCHQEGPYTHDEMYAMAGLVPVEQQEKLGIKGNPNIHKLGLETELDSRTKEAKEEFLRQTKKYTYSK